jgi:hypothetical protein
MIYVGFFTWEREACVKLHSSGKRPRFYSLSNQMTQFNANLSDRVQGGCELGCQLEPCEKSSFEDA